MSGISQALVAVMRDVGHIGKDRLNQQQQFKFRGIDDVYNALHETLAKHGVVTLPVCNEVEYAERAGKEGKIQTHVRMRTTYVALHEDGSSVNIGPVPSEALDTSDKATNKGLAFAHKYALLQAFCIPTSDVAEGDKETIEAGPKKAKWTKGEDKAATPVHPFDALLASMNAAKNHNELDDVSNRVRVVMSALTPIEVTLLREAKGRKESEFKKAAELKKAEPGPELAAAK